MALVQLAVGADKEKNVARAATFVKEAAANGASLVVLPVSSPTPRLLP